MSKREYPNVRRGGGALLKRGAIPTIRILPMAEFVLFKTRRCGRSNLLPCPVALPFCQMRQGQQDTVERPGLSSSGKRRVRLWNAISVLLSWVVGSSARSTADYCLLGAGLEGIHVDPASSSAGPRTPGRFHHHWQYRVQFAGKANFRVGG